MKKKEKNVYADLSNKKIIAPNKRADQPKGKKIVGGDVQSVCDGNNDFKAWKSPTAFYVAYMLSIDSYQLAQLFL